MNTRTYSITEIASAIGISRPTAYRLARNGEFGAIRVGKSVRVPAGALAAWARDVGYDELADAVDNERGGNLTPTTARAAPRAAPAQTSEIQDVPGVNVH